LRGRIVAPIPGPDHAGKSDYRIGLLKFRRERRPTRRRPIAVASRRLKIFVERAMPRTASITRQTAETRVELHVDVDGTGASQIDTGVGFFNHMLTLLSKHSLFDLRISAQGDLDVDQHHTVEDVGICLGKALAEALGDKAGIARYGSITLPMEETLVTTAVDLGGRMWFEYRVAIPSEKIGQFDSELVEVFWQAVAANAQMNLHFVLHHGKNSHHIAEGVFKSAARALRQAAAVDPRQPGVPSSKGTLTE
jgi:imidazoleglycerol-phosphate dehydratase